MRASRRRVTAWIRRRTDDANDLALHPAIVAERHDGNYCTTLTFETQKSKGFGELVFVKTQKVTAVSAVLSTAAGLVIQSP